MKYANTNHNTYNNKETVEWEIVKHLEGMLIGPLLVAFGMSNFFTKIIKQKTEIKQVRVRDIDGLARIEVKSEQLIFLDDD